MSSRSLDSFREGCGATGPLLLEATTASGTPVGAWCLEAPFAVIGRDARNDVVLADEQVSSRHVYLQVIAGEAFWVDLESRAGVMRGGVAEPCGWLPLLGTIGIGPFQLRLTGGVGPTAEGESDRSDPRAWRVRDLGPAQRVYLDLPGNSNPPQRLHLTRSLTLVGRSDDCRLRFSDDRISRFQAALIRTGAQLWVVELLSRKGLRVNRSRTRWSALGSGDTVQFGPYRLVARYGESSSRSGTRPAAMPPAPTSLPEVPAMSSEVEMAPLLMPSGTPIAPLVEQFGQLQQQMFDQFQQTMQELLNMAGSLHRDRMEQIHEELAHIREISQEIQALHVPAATETDARIDAIEEIAPAGESPSDNAATLAPDEPDATPDDEVYKKLTLRIATLSEERQSRWEKILGMIAGNNGGDAAC